MTNDAKCSATAVSPALSAWLEEIREYLSSRQDVNDGSDGPRPNEEMTLLSNLDEALRRPIFSNGNTAGPSAVEEWKTKGFMIGYEHAQELDRLRAENVELKKENLEYHWDRLRAFSAALGSASSSHETLEGVIDELKGKAFKESQRAERAEAALRGGPACTKIAPETTPARSNIPRDCQIPSIDW